MLWVPRLMLLSDCVNVLGSVSLSLSLDNSECIHFFFMHFFFRLKLTFDDMTNSTI